MRPGYAPVSARDSSWSAEWAGCGDGGAQAATQWERSASRWAPRHDDLARLIGDVGAGWQDVVCDAAITYLTRIARRIAGDRALVEQIPSVLDEHAAMVAAAQRLLRGAVAATAGTPIAVGPDGSVSLDPQAAALLTVTNPALLALLITHARAIAAAISHAVAIATE
ncbi:MAG: hypothetical protein ACRDTE_11185 [Pseudonocardiaceae bacterium]